jgi:antitoxin (DNA-binding transcriptional repressor) of toxin-antitoxin stability system
MALKRPKDFSTVANVPLLKHVTGVDYVGAAAQEQMPLSALNGGIYYTAHNIGAWNMYTEPIKSIAGLVTSPTIVGVLKIEIYDDNGNIGFWDSTFFAIDTILQTLSQNIRTVGAAHSHVITKAELYAALIVAATGPASTGTPHDHNTVFQESELTNTETSQTTPPTTATTGSAYVQNQWIGIKPDISYSLNPSTGVMSLRHNQITYQAGQAGYTSRTGSLTLFKQTNVNRGKIILLRQMPA